MKSMILKFIVASLLYLTAESIGISASSRQERCMIVSSVDSEQFLKIDLKFVRFGDQSLQEGYRIVLHNTETHQEQAFQVYQGTFRKQFELDQNVVYRLCFKIVLSDSRLIEEQFEYNAGVKHKFSISESKISIPDKLLKSKDLTETYTYLGKMKELMGRASQHNEQIKTEQTETFEGQKSKMGTFKWITILQIVVICLLGGFQYVKLKQIIDRKQKC